MSLSDYWLGKSLMFCTLLLAPLNSVGLNYQPDIFDADWSASGDEFECRLVQSIPDFGEAVFLRRAGEMVRFQLKTLDSPAQPGTAYLVASAPVWKPNVLDVVIDKVDTATSTTPIEIEPPLSEQVLAYLKQGMFPTFAEWQWQADEQLVEVGLSAVNFMPAYRVFQQCESSLLTLEFSDLKDSQIMFDSAEFELSAIGKQHLRIIAQLIKVDASIKECHIAGYTDDIGTSRNNMELSRHRAEAVEAYLLELGVDPAMIKTTFHGEANWVSKSMDEASRAQNRRVHIRLEQDI